MSEAAADDSSSASQPKVKELRTNGTNFHLGKVSAQVQLPCTGWSDALKAQLPPADDDEKEETKKQRKAAAGAFWIIWSALGTELQNMCFDVEAGDAHALWAQLLKKFESDTAANREDVLSKFHRLRMAEGETFDAYRVRRGPIATHLSRRRTRCSCCGTTAWAT